MTNRVMTEIIYDSPIRVTEQMADSLAHAWGVEVADVYHEEFDDERLTISHIVFKGYFPLSEARALVNRLGVHVAQVVRLVGNDMQKIDARSINNDR